MTLAELWDTVSDAGLSAGREIGKNARKLSRYDREDVLAAIGLEPKRSTMDIVLPAAGIFAAGILAGVGLGMLFAPKPGYELRENLSDQLKGMKQQAKEKSEQVGSEVNPVI